MTGKKSKLAKKKNQQKYSLYRKSDKKKWAKSKTVQKSDKNTRQKVAEMENV